jgi:hypothetical protein
MYPARCLTVALIFTSWVAIRTDGPRLECSIRIWPRSRPSTTATLIHNHNHHAQSNKVRSNMPPCCCCCDWDARRKTQLHFLTLCLCSFTGNNVGSHASDQCQETVARRQGRRPPATTTTASAWLVCEKDRRQETPRVAGHG